MNLWAVVIGVVLAAPLCPIQFKGNVPDRAAFEAVIASLPVPIPATEVREPNHWKHGRSVIGWCSIEDYHIELSRADDPMPKGFVFAHEMGHVYYWTSLSAGGRATWKAWWSDHKSEMPRDYARNNSDEGFAESFAETYDLIEMPKSLHRSNSAQSKVRSYFERN